MVKPSISKTVLSYFVVVCISVTSLFAFCDDVPSGPKFDFYSYDCFIQYVVSCEETSQCYGTIKKHIGAQWWYRYSQPDCKDFLFKYLRVDTIEETIDCCPQEQGCSE
jgi:hypothetical protein